MTSLLAWKVDVRKSSGAVTLPPLLRSVLTSMMPFFTPCSSSPPVGGTSSIMASTALSIYTSSGRHKHISINGFKGRSASTTATPTNLDFGLPHADGFYDNYIIPAHTNERANERINIKDSTSSVKAERHTQRQTPQEHGLTSQLRTARRRRWYAARCRLGCRSSATVGRTRCRPLRVRTFASCHRGWILLLHHSAQ